MRDDGLAYVVIKTKDGEQVYRCGNASRFTAKKDPRVCMLFTCALPHVLLQDKPEDKAALAAAEVVHAGNGRFAALDAKYLQGCRNPPIKSALPKKQ